LSGESEHAVEPALAEDETRRARRRIELARLLERAEIVAFDDNRRPSFERLQRRMHVTAPSSVRRLAASTPVVYAIFDLLFCDGRSLLGRPYTERRAALEGLGLDDGYHSPQVEAAVRLNTNESPFGPSPRVLAAVRAEAAESLRLYPDPTAMGLREALAAYHHVTPEQVFVGNGSDEVLAHAFVALLKHEAPLLFPDITYSFYPVYCRLFDITYETVALNDGLPIRLADYRRRAQGGGDQAAQDPDWKATGICGSNTPHPERWRGERNSGHKSSVDTETVDASRRDRGAFHGPFAFSDDAEPESLLRRCHGSGVSQPSGVADLRSVIGLVERLCVDTSGASRRCQCMGSGTGFTRSCNSVSSGTPPLSTTSMEAPGVREWARERGE